MDESRDCTSDCAEAVWIARLDIVRAGCAIVGTAIDAPAARVVGGSYIRATIEHDAQAGLSLVTASTPVGMANVGEQDRSAEHHPFIGPSLRLRLLLQCNFS